MKVDFPNNGSQAFPAQAQPPIGFTQLHHLEQRIEHSRHEQESATARLHMAKGWLMDIKRNFPATREMVNQALTDIE